MIEWHSPFTDQKYYHPYASTGIDNNVLEFDTDNVARLMPGKSAAAIDNATSRINQHYIKSQRHIKRAFGSKMVENFQEYSWGLALNCEMGLGRDKIELLNLVFSSDESKLNEKEFYKIITFHTSYRKLTGRRKKVIFRDVKTCFKKFAVKPSWSPYTVTKHEVLEILDMTGIELDIDFERLSRTLRNSDAEFDRMHMLLMNDPLVSGKISAGFAHKTPVHRFRIPSGTTHSLGDDPLEWIDSDSDDASANEDPMSVFEASIALEEQEFGRVIEEMERQRREAGESSTAPVIDEPDDADSSGKAKQTKKKQPVGKSKFDMYNKPLASKGTKRGAQHVARVDPAVEALFAKVPKSAAFAEAPADDALGPPPKRSTIRNRIATAHAYGKKEAAVAAPRIDIFIPNLPFANKPIRSKAVVEEVDSEMEHEIELGKRYASVDFADLVDSGADSRTTGSVTTDASASVISVSKGGGLVTPEPVGTAIQAGESKKAGIVKKRDSLFGQKAKPKKSFLLDTAPIPKPTNKLNRPKQVVFNENVTVDEISLVGADEASVASSITHDDSMSLDFELLSQFDSSTTVYDKKDADTQKDATQSAIFPDQRINDTITDGSAKNPPQQADKEVILTAPGYHKPSILKPVPTVDLPTTTVIQSTLVKSDKERKPSTSIPLKGATEPAVAPTRQKPAVSPRVSMISPKHSERPTEVEENDAIKFLSLLSDQTNTNRMLQRDRPKTALPRKSPAYLEKIERAVRPKTAPQPLAELSVDEEEEYCSFLSLLENYTGELIAPTPGKILAKKYANTKDGPPVVSVSPRPTSGPLPKEIRPKSSGTARTPILLSPRSQAVLDKPPKSPSPRAFEVLDLPEPIIVPFPLAALYLMPSKDIEVMVPKTMGQLRLQIRHDDEGDIHGLFVHGFRANCKAEELGIIKVGDELLKVNDVIVKGGYLEDVVEALKSHNGDEVAMIIRRHSVPTIDESPSDFDFDTEIIGNVNESPRPYAVSNQPFTDEDDFPSLYDLFTLPAQDIEIKVPKTNGQLRIQLRHDDEGDVHGLFVHGFRPFSKAEEQGLIRVADEVIRVNGVVVKGGYLEDIVEILQNHTDDTVPIVVRRYSAEQRPGSRGSQLEHYSRGDDFSPRPFEVTNFVGTGGSFPSLQVLFKLPSKDVKIMVPKTNGQLRVQLRHDDEGELHGLFVHGFRPYSKAEEQGLLKVGDEIFKVNGMFVKGGYLEDVVSALKDHDEEAVEIVVRRHFPKK